jgi:myo-inositol 2-dehydrogenase/D-chiro-inositol 1-dehydrogenase
MSFQRASSFLQCRDIIQSAQEKPWLKVMCGFSRRFDASYCEAWMKMKSGLIGVSTIFRSQTCDKYNEGGFFRGLFGHVRWHFC